MSDYSVKFTKVGNDLKLKSIKNAGITTNYNDAVVGTVDATTGAISPNADLDSALADTNIVPTTTMGEKFSNLGTAASTGLSSLRNTASSGLTSFKDRFKSTPTDASTAPAPSLPPPPPTKEEELSVLIDGASAIIRENATKIIDANVNIQRINEFENFNFNTFKPNYPIDKITERIVLIDTIYDEIDGNQDIGANKVALKGYANIIKEQLLNIKDAVEKYNKSKSMFGRFRRGGATRKRAKKSQINKRAKSRRTRF